MLPVCTSCGQYVRSGDVSCPFCDARLVRPDPGLRLPSPSSVALGLSLVALNACFVGVAKYGVAPMDDSVVNDGGDADEDGYVSEGEGGDDCDDDDATVNPGADEVPGDGVDSNCDGEDDT